MRPRELSGIYYLKVHTHTKKKNNTGADLKNTPWPALQNAQIKKLVLMKNLLTEMSDPTNEKRKKRSVLFREDIKYF